LRVHAMNDVAGILAAILAVVAYVAAWRVRT
jgi:hypothetical protein